MGRGRTREGIFPCPGAPLGRQDEGQRSRPVGPFLSEAVDGGGGAGRRYVVVGLAGGRADATSFFLCSFNIFYDFKYGHVVRGRV